MKWVSWSRKNSKGKRKLLNFKNRSESKRLKKIVLRKNRKKPTGNAFLLKMKLTEKRELPMKKPNERNAWKITKPNWRSNNRWKPNSNSERKKRKLPSSREKLTKRLNSKGNWWSKPKAIVQRWWLNRKLSGNKWRLKWNQPVWSVNKKQQLCEWLVRRKTRLAISKSKKRNF